MKKSIAILLVAIMALTVVSSAGVVAAQDGHRNVDHGKNFNDQRNRNDRERNRFDCIKLIKIRFHNRWIWIPVNICRANERFDRFGRML